MHANPCPTARDVLADSKGVLRLNEVLEETATSELEARREIDDLVLGGEVERLPVGDHIVLKCTDEFTVPNREVVNLSEVDSLA